MILPNIRFSRSQHNTMFKTSLHKDRDSHFNTTCWTLVHQAGNDSTASRQALEKILAQYWRPVYHFLVCKGYQSEDAKDLAQSFFEEILIGKKLSEQADSNKGRFRTFLLTALTRFVSNQERAARTLKRKPQAGLCSLSEFDTYEISDDLKHRTADDSFHKAWIEQILSQVLCELQSVMEKSHKEIYWQVFFDRVVQPIISNKEAPALIELSEKYHIQPEAKISNMIVTVKRRFKSLMIKELSKLVAGDADLEQEIFELWKILKKNLQD